jgi:BirA family transcriptional regulator, biotin operon repressor / biotin---[acetyl-CoA-carboxylase] ligase
MIGQKIIHLDTVDSTNNYTANLQKEGKIPHGTVILADEQTAGRGQRGASWTSSAGENLLLSVYLTPDNLSVVNQPALTHFISLSLIDFLRKIGISGKIKWPNDIYVNDQKIAGILIENSIRSSYISAAIIGVGFNVNQQSFEGVNATSLKLQNEQHFQLKEVLFSWIQEMNLLWAELTKGNLKLLESRYKQELYLLNESAFYLDETGEFEGIVRDVDNQGYLILEKNTELRTYDLKEIRLVGRSKL